MTKALAPKGATPSRISLESGVGSDQKSELLSPAISRRIWRLQYGPCWCRGMPGEEGSFDFVRSTTTQLGVGDLDFNLLLLSDRVIDGSRPIFLQVDDLVPNPRLVVATSSCPAAQRFWDELPVAWSPVDEVVPVDHWVEECINGRPEALLVAVLAMIRQREASQSETPMSRSEVGHPGSITMSSQQ